MIKVAKRGIFLLFLLLYCSNNSSVTDIEEIKEDRQDIYEVDIYNLGGFCEGIRFEVSPVPISQRESNRIVTIIKDVDIVDDPLSAECDINGDGIIDGIGGFSSLSSFSLRQLTEALKKDIVDGKLSLLFEFQDIIAPEIPYSEGGKIIYYEGIDFDQNPLNNFEGGAYFLIDENYLDDSGNPIYQGELSYVNKFFLGSYSDLVLSFSYGNPLTNEDIPVILVIRNVMIKGCASPYFTSIKRFYMCGYVLAKELADIPSPIIGFDSLLSLLVSQSNGKLIDIDVNQDGGLDRVYLSDDSSIIAQCYDREQRVYRFCSSEELQDGISMILKMEAIWVNLLENDYY